MCTGMELALVAQAAGGLLSAGAQKSAADSEAAILSQNAQVARWQAKDAIRRGTLDAARLQRQVGQLIGSQRAGYAGQGLALDSGTPLEVAQDTAMLGAEDVAQIRINAANEAWGFRVRADSLDFQSKQAKKGGTQAALGTLLGTAGTVAFLGGKV